MSAAQDGDGVRHSRAPLNGCGGEPRSGPERIVREPECKHRTGLSRSTRWRLERAGGFPRRRRVSPGTTGWLDSEIAAWVANRGLV
jgi:prophage regulatory protein